MQRMARAWKKISLPGKIGIVVCASLVLPIVAWAGASYTIVDPSGLTGFYSHTVIGSDGFPVISYEDAGNGDLKVAKCSNSGCTLSTLTTLDSTGDVGGFNAIAIGTDHFPVISYNDADNSTLKVAKCSNSGCTASTRLTTVDASGVVGTHTSIVIGTDGNPVISYYDGTNSALKVAKCSNSGCTLKAITTLDSAGVVGTNTSIAIGSDGFPVISYYDQTNADLKVAHCTNSGCTTGTVLTTVDSTGSVGQYTSIAVGSDNLPVISYYDQTNNHLKVAHCANAACTSSTLTTLDTLTSGGQFTSIAIGSNGLPVISYNASSNTVKVARCFDTACDSNNVGTLVDVGGGAQYTSIAIERDGQAVASYYDVVDLVLKLALTGVLTKTPTTPTSFNANATGDDVALSWTNPTDRYFDSISIYRDTAGYPSFGAGTLVTQNQTGTSFTDADLPPGTYLYSIFALDSEANVSVGAGASATVAASSSSSSSSSVTAGGGGSAGGSRGSGTELKSALTLHAIQTTVHGAAESSSSSSSSIPAQKKTTATPFRARTCARVMKWFAGNDTVIKRLNVRLMKWFGFTCGT